MLCAPFALRHRCYQNNQCSVNNKLHFIEGDIIIFDEASYYAPGFRQLTKERLDKAFPRCDSKQRINKTNHSFKSIKLSECHRCLSCFALYRSLMKKSVDRK